LLLALTDVSRRQNLGMEDEILAKLPQDVPNSPRLALQRALDLARAGKKDEGLKLFAGAEKTLPWQVAKAEYLEATGDDHARLAWIVLGDANPDDVKVQNLILKEAGSASADREFFARTIDRVHKLTGDDALGWRFARARYLLTSDDKRRDSAEAVAILRSLVGQSPDTPEYRVLLAAGLVNLGDANGAIDHLKAAVERSNAGADAMLDLIKLLMAQNRGDEARAYLDRASRAPGLIASNRQSLALLLAQQGQIPQALAMLQPIADSLDATGQLLYAELLRKRGQNPDAEAAYKKLLADPQVSADAIASAADFFASTNRVDQAKQIISKLNDPRFSAKDRTPTLARFDELYGNKDDAKNLLAMATQDSPQDLGAWRSLIEFYIRNNQPDQAIAAADQALAKLPNNDQLTTLRAQATALVSSKSGQSDLGPLIDSLSKDPRNAAQVEMLKTIQEARQTKQSPQQVVAKLKIVADKYPSYWPLQAQLAKAYLDLNQPNDAAPVVERLMDTRPNDPDIARLAVAVYRAANRWRDVKRAADRWRQRILENPTDADIAIAEADIALNDVKAATDQLASYVQAVKDQPQHNPTLTAAVCKLLVVNGKLTEARAMLEPLLSQGPLWRRLWLTLAAGSITPAPAASEWIRIAAVSVPDDQFDELFTVAQAWQQLGARLNDKDATNNATTLLREQLVDRTDLGPQPAMMLASLDTDAGDMSAAEELYRKALKIDENLPDALNNLAYILLQRNGDMKEAKDFATKAIALSPTVGAFHDTLARINEKLNIPDQAQAEFTEALRLDPTSLDARIGLCRTLTLAGKRDKSQQELQRIDTQLNGTVPPSESTRRELQSLRESLSSSSVAE
jgi:tetratricopeptide (TPR) repeat protein